MISDQYGWRELNADQCGWRELSDIRPVWVEGIVIVLVHLYL